MTNTIETIPEKTRGEIATKGFIKPGQSGLSEAVLHSS